MRTLSYTLLRDENNRPVPVRDHEGNAITFRSETEAERAVVLLALRRIVAYFEGKLDFDETLHVPEYFVPTQGREGPTPRDVV